MAGEKMAQDKYLGNLIDRTEVEEELERALKNARKTAIEAIVNLGNERDALVNVLTGIMHVVDCVNPAGHACSIADMTEGLLEIRKAAFQAVAVPAEFVECDICRTKPGSPTLCNSCIARRTKFYDQPPKIVIVPTPGDLCQGTKLVDAYSIKDGEKYLGQKPCPGCRACS